MATILEATNGTEEMFGLERLKLLLRATADADYQDFLVHLFKAFRNFGVSVPPDDDCSAIVMICMVHCHKRQAALNNISDVGWLTSSFVCLEDNQIIDEFLK